MDVLVPKQLDAEQLGEVRNLLTRANQADGHPALPEPQRSLVADDHLDPARMTVLLAYDHAALVAAAFLAPATDDTDALNLVVDPWQRDRPDNEATRTALLDAALDATKRPIRLWATRATAEDDQFAAVHGFTLERELIQMRVALPLGPDIVERTRPIETRPFEPGRDDEAWVDINNRAFAGHPEQGNWTVAMLHERLSVPWVDLDGFLVADDPEGHGLIGSCWTKVHRDTTPPMGEIYVISVDPERHSAGWGRALTVAGLRWLAEQGLSVGMLYTDAANKAAVATYSGLGFTVDHADRAYLQQSEQAAPG